MKTMQKTGNHKPKILSDNLFPVVGVGASAGGLEAFKRLLKSIPEDSGMAFILVQHLDPNHESILTELLQKVTRIPVQEITNNVKVAPNHIYIIPSNKLLTATDGILKLEARPAKKNMPIDLFFSSLAEVHQSHAIGVVLSGTATDGTLGLKAIKNHGGITFAQEQESAAYDGMPQSAIDADVVDFILPPEKITEQLQALHEVLKSNLENNGVNIEHDLEEGYRNILTLLRARKGVDFTYYKQNTIRRRISRRIALSQKAGVVEYYHHLKQDGDEQDILYQDLLIPVTEFFRDPKVFDTIYDIVFPVLTKERQENEPLRIWIAGCSTGEEAYSMLICLHEYMETNSTPYEVQVFATDVSEVAIGKARIGTYKKSEVGGLSAERLEKYFTRTDGKFRVNKSIRDSCVFAHHNYLKDPPFARIDLISCRNSLIYFESFLQKKALTTFHYALKEKGFLLLGKSETISHAADLFSSIEKNAKIFTRKPVRGRFLHVIPDRSEESIPGYNGERKSETLKDDFQKNADEVLLSRYAPPGVVINNDMEIVQFRGATGKWLESPPGKPSLNVFKMARMGLAFELRNLLHKVQKSKAPSIKHDIPIDFSGKESLVTIEVVPLLHTIDSHFLVLFRESSQEAEPGLTDKEKATDEKSSRLSREKARVRKLENDLALAREDMRSITQDQEASNESLQSANEELLSGSEELQSLNEELETSKEEIQTSNEELIIVNQELYDRNEQLNLARLYAESIVTTIREPIVILNKQLHVRSANRAFYNKFQTTQEETEGRPFFDLAGKQWDIPELQAMLAKIISQKTNIVDFEIMGKFPGIGERLMLLNASRILRDTGEDQSILLAIEDITESRKVTTDLKHFSAELEAQVIERTASLNEAIIELRHSNKNLEQFAYIASHDLQEPLRKIRTFASLLEENHAAELPGQAGALLSKISKAAERMSTLIKEVLNFSRILQGHAIFEKTDLDAILNNVLNDFELLIAEKKAVISREALPFVESLPLQMNQLFYNLISNALKFSSRDRLPHIEITHRPFPLSELKVLPHLNPKLSYIEISIRDNGIGFDQQYVDQVFLIFHRLNGREEYSGTGIGLALAKSIVINHHGEIIASSVKGVGSVFRIILPLRQFPADRF